MENTSAEGADSDFKIPPKPVDMTVACKTCQKEFLWSAKEQKYYEKKGFKKKPQKCNSCRERANKLRDNSMFYIHCGLCDADGVMLAPPPKDRVAICEDCFNKLALELEKQKASAKIGP
jgi:hypothetical protein